MGDERLLRAEAGSATVEFVLVVPLIVLVLVGCLEVATLARTRIELVAAAREGARAAATSPDPARAAEAVRRALGDGRGDRVRIGIARPHVVGRPASVELEYRHHFRAPLLDRLSVVVSARATMRVER